MDLKCRDSWQQYYRDFVNASTVAILYHRENDSTSSNSIRWSYFLPVLTYTNIQIQVLRQTSIHPFIAPFRPYQLPQWRIAQLRFLSDETRKAIDKAVATAPVVLFMKGTPEMPQCGFSRASIQVLGMQGVNPQKFTAFNVLEDDELRQGIYLRLEIGLDVESLTEAT